MRLGLLLPALFLLALAVRAPTLGLPLEGASARIASAGARLADGGRCEAAGVAPLMPCLVAAAQHAGLRPTAALRWLDVLAACILAPLVLLLAGRLGLERRRALLAAAVFAVHPLALLGAGGIAPGSAALGAALALTSLVLLAGPAPGVRRLALLPLGLLCAADATMLALVPPLLVLFVVREPGPRVQTAGTLLLAGALLASSLTWLQLPGAPTAGAAFSWVVAAALGVLLPGVPGGTRLLAALGAGRAWLACGVLGGAAWLAGAPFPALVVLPLVIVAGLEGSLAMWRVHGRRVAAAAFGAALVASIGLVAGGLQATLAPRTPPTMGRLHLLGEAVRAAADVAGENGWIVLAIAEGRPEEQASLADLNPRHWTWSQRGSSADADALRHLRVFPASSFESGRDVVVVAEAGGVEPIHTFDGAGIFHQEVVRSIGPYVVVRARRP